MKLKNKYCSYCGRKLNIVLSERYDVNTGKKKLKYENCPIRDCVHGYHDYHWFSGKCRKCGDVMVFLL